MTEIIISENDDNDGRPLRAISIWSGLPNFQGRSPAGLLADFHEFATLPEYC